MTALPLLLPDGTPTTLGAFLDRPHVLVVFLRHLV
jgi:hypothetical protein